MRRALSMKSDVRCFHRGQFKLKSAGAAFRLAIRIIPARAFAPLPEKPRNLARQYASQDFLRQRPRHHRRPTEKEAQ
jgi:hypothetical protein